MDRNFKIKFVECSEDTLKNIGFDSCYIHNALDKHRFFSIRVSDLTCAQANIIKQTALSVGADASVHREVITGNIPFSDCVLSGSKSQILKICEKLKHQPFKLQSLANEILNSINFRFGELKINKTIFDFNSQPYIMGILNVTPDSFSDGGKYCDIDSAVIHYENLVESGADIIDIGGESTRPNSIKVDVQEEIRRIIPVIEKVRTIDKNTVISVDTQNSLTAKLAIEAGANIVNDVSALENDENLLDVVVKNNGLLILNHSKLLDEAATNSDFVNSLYDYIEQKIEFCVKHGLDRSHIIVDPGIGFNKSVNQNYEIINRLGEFKSLNCPILIGHSRKRLLQEFCGVSDNLLLDSATMALSTKIIDNGANILRVHNVKLHKILLNMLASFR